MQNTLLRLMGNSIPEHSVYMIFLTQHSVHHVCVICFSFLSLALPPTRAAVKSDMSCWLSYTIAVNRYQRERETSSVKIFSLNYFICSTMYMYACIRPLTFIYYSISSLIYSLILLPSYSLNLVCWLIWRANSSNNTECPWKESCQGRDLQMLEQVICLIFIPILYVDCVLLCLCACLFVFYMIPCFCKCRSYLSHFERL